MPELSRDAQEDGFHEIQLSGKQLVFLFIVTTMVSVTIFLFGVYVGRGAGAAARQQESSSDAQATAESPAAAATQAQAPVQAPPQPTEPPPDAEAGEDPTKTPAPAPAAAAPKGEPSSVAKPLPPAPVADVPTSGRPGAFVVQVFASKDRVAAEGLVKKLLAKGYPAFLSAPASNTVPQFYRVQVGRYNERREAEQVVRRIAKEEQFKPWISR